VVNIIDQEGLGPDTARGNAGLFVLIDDLLGECGLGETLERHLYRGRFALGGEVEAVGVDEGDRLLVGEDGSTGVVQVLCSFCSEQLPVTKVSRDGRLLLTVRKTGVQPKYSAAVLAVGQELSILARRVLYSARVISLLPRNSSC